MRVSIEEKLGGTKTSNRIHEYVIILSDHQGLALAYFSRNFSRKIAWFSEKRKKRKKREKWGCFSVNNFSSIFVTFSFSFFSNFVPFFTNLCHFSQFFNGF